MPNTPVPANAGGLPEASQRRTLGPRARAIDRRPRAALSRLWRIRVLRLQIAVLLLKLKAVRALDGVLLSLGRRA